MNVSITSLDLTDFKSHARTHLDLAPFSVLVGPNGAGKSTVLTALRLAAGGVAGARSALDDPHIHPRHLIRWGQQNSRITLAGSEVFLSEAISPIDGRREWTGTWTQTVGGHPERTEVGWPGLDAKANPVSMGTAPVRTVALFRFDGEALAAPAEPSLSPALGMRGEGLAAVLADLRLSRLDTFQAIVENLRGLVPAVVAVNLRPARIDDAHRGEIIGHELSLDFAGAKKVAGHAVSEGTLIALGLLTALHTATGPTLLLIDDLERSLHPKAQWTLIDMIRARQKVDLDLQVVATSHSPYLVSSFEPEEVVVVAFDNEQGLTQCRRLSEHPRAQRALQVLNTGEFLGSVGEDWVLEETGDA